MKHIISILLLFSFLDLYSQKEYLNYNDLMSYLDFSRLETDDLPIIRDKISVKKNYNFQGTLSDFNYTKIIESSILQHDKLVYEEWIITKYSEKEINRIDSLGRFNSPPSYKYKVLGKYYPNSEINSLFVLRQKKENKSSIDGKQLYLYLLNIDTNNRLISTALIGRYEKVKSLSFLNVNSKISIDKNIICITDKMVLVPSDICQNCKKKDYTDIIDYKFLIKENGQIEKIE